MVTKGSFLLSTTWLWQTFSANCTYVVRLGLGDVQWRKKMGSQWWRQELEARGASPSWYLQEESMGCKETMATGRDKTFGRQLKHVDRSVAPDGCREFSRPGKEQRNPQCTDVSLTAALLPIRSICSSLLNGRRDRLRERNPVTRQGFDPLEENILNSFHERFPFKIAPSVLNPAEEDKVSKKWCTQG